MIVTPFGDVEYGSVRPMLSWLHAHDSKHHSERQILAQHGVPLTPFTLLGPMNPDWFSRHALMHVAMAPFVPSETSTSRMLLAHGWSDKQSFYTWHKMHNDLHQAEDQALANLGTPDMAFFPSTTKVVNAFASAGAAAAQVNNNVNNAFAVASGALTAGVLSTVLNLSGKGSLDYFDTVTVDNTSRTLRVQILVEGVAVFDFTSGAIVSFPTGFFFGGFAVSPIAPLANESPIYFNTSLVVNIASSLTETGKFTSHYIYHKY